MSKKQKEALLAAMNAELEAAKATKEAARAAMDEVMFDDAAHRVRVLEDSIHYVSSPRYKIDACTAALIASNVD